MMTIRLMNFPLNISGELPASKTGPFVFILPNFSLQLFNKLFISSKNVSFTIYVSVNTRQIFSPSIPDENINSLMKSRNSYVPKFFVIFGQQIHAELSWLCNNKGVTFNM